MRMPPNCRRVVSNVLEQPIVSNTRVGGELFNMTDRKTDWGVFHCTECDYTTASIFKIGCPECGNPLFLPIEENSMNAPRCPACGDILFGMTFDEVEIHIVRCAPTPMSAKVISAYFDFARTKVEPETSETYATDGSLTETNNE